MSFFNKIGEKATEMYNTTAEKTNKITKEVKLKSTISENKNKMTKLYQEIGEEIFNQYTNGELKKVDKDIEEKFYQLELYKKEIDEAQEQIYSLKSLKLCENCKKEMSLIARFCPFCGAEQKNESIYDKNIQNEKESSEDKIEENEITEIVLANEDSKREPIIEISKDTTILDIEEPEIIVEEIGKKEEEE